LLLAVAAAGQELVEQVVEGQVVFWLDPLILYQQVKHIIS
jgi:hypothetical protein